MNAQGTILVVEHTPADLELLVDILTAEGYQVQPAESGELALAAVAAQPPELILLDLRLPGLDGFEVCRRLKVQPESRDIPVMFSGVSGGRAERLEGLKLGVVDYITKPFEREELLTRIQTHLELRRLRVRLGQQAADLQRANEQLLNELAKRKRGEESLRAAHQLIEGIINAIPVRVFWKDKNSVYLGCNAVFARDAGFAEPKDLIGKDDYQMAWRDQAELYRAGDRQVFESGCPRPLVEEPQTTPEGNTITLLTSKIPLRDSKGKVSGMIGTSMDVTDRRQAEEALRERVKLQDQLVRIAASVPGLIYSLLMRPDGSTRLPYASGALSAIFDLQPKDVAENAAPIFSLIHPDDLGHVMATVAESARTLNPWRDDFRVCHTRLGEIWVEGHSVPQREPDGSTLWHGFIQDITERKRAEEIIQRERHFSQAALDSLPGLFYLFDDQSQFLRWNKNFEKVSGYSADELTRMTPLDLFDGKEKGRIADAIQRAFQEGEVTVEADFLSKDQTRTPHFFTGKLLHFDQKSCLIGMGIDITEKMKTEASLRESEERLRLAMDAALMGTWERNLKTNLLTWSQMKEHLNGYEPGTFPGTDAAFQALLHPDSRAVYAAAHQRVRHGDGIFQAELHFRLRDGRERWGFVSGRLIRDPSGQPERILGIDMDITARKQLEQERTAIDAQLRHQQKLESIGTLAGGVAHEINNPINGILNYAQLIQDRLPADSPLVEFTGEILHETQRVVTIVHNLLTFARPENQSHSPARLAEIVEGTLSLIRTVVRHDQITLNVNVPADLPALRCRSQQIQQVLMNLMTNARDALNERYPGHDPDKVINLEARLLEQEGRRWVRVTVEDHGAGISPEVRGRMFDPFFTTKPRDKGTGLGLAISHGIVKEHEGQLTVESEPGRFTRMHVDLPVESGGEV